MIGYTYCSGIGAPEVAAPWIDWRLASEIEDFPRAVLSYRFGHRDARHRRPDGSPALMGDFTTIRPAIVRRLNVPLPNLIMAGTPCQAFSVAGARGSLSDSRGNLTMEFVRNVHAFANVTDGPDGLRWVVWENVPGVLSTDDNAFGCFVGGLVGADDALPPPPGDRWPGAGMVEGPRGRAAWRIFNAQHFGVAQRRRRLFVVFCPRGRGDPAAILFERKSRSGHPASGRTSRQDPSGTVAESTRSGSGDDGLIMSTAEGAQGLPCLTAACGEKHLNNQTPLIAFDSKASGQHGFGVSEEVAPTLRAMTNRPGASPNGGGQIAVAYSIQERAAAANPNTGPDGAGWNEEVAFTMEARTNSQFVAFSMRGREEGAVPEAEAEDLSPTLRSSEGGSTRPFIAYDLAQVTSPENVSNPQSGDPCHPLTTVAKDAAFVSPSCAYIRRITPVEAERLQGFPDGHTAIPWRWRKVDEETAAWVSRHADPEQVARDAESWVTDAAPDGRRFKALGNSMAVPNVQWILDRIREFEGSGTAT